MADMNPLFNIFYSGSGVTTTKDDWYDLGYYGGISPIPTGRQMFLGYVVTIAEDKNLIFEIRPNIIGQSTGTIANTILRGYAAVQSGLSDPGDLYNNGYVNTLAPITGVSTGVEKLWLRVRSGSNVAGAFDFMVYYNLL